MKRSLMDSLDDNPATKKSKIMVIVGVDDDNTSLFRSVRSLMHDQIKTDLMSKAIYSVDWYHRGISLCSWDFIDIRWPKLSNPIYHQIVKYELRRELNRKVLDVWKFYCLLKMVCK